jgi:hypothetical protein
MPRKALRRATWFNALKSSDYLYKLPSPISQRGPSDRGNLAAQFRHRGAQ